MRALVAAGIPTGVLAAPVIPALNDRDLESILEAASEAGAGWAGYTLLRLPHEVRDLFREWLDLHYPLKADHVMSLVRQSRGGRENDPDFGSRMVGEGVFAQVIAQRFQLACRRFGLGGGRLELDTGQFRPPSLTGQLALF